MNNIQFEEENFKSHRTDQDKIKTGSKISDWIIKMELAKDANSANLIMIIATILFFGASIYVFVYGFNLPQKQQVFPQNNPFQSQ